jgi:hypothetical protein
MAPFISTKLKSGFILVEAHYDSRAVSRRVALHFVNAIANLYRLADMLCLQILLSRAQVITSILFDIICFYMYYILRYAEDNYPLIARSPAQAHSAGGEPPPGAPPT